MSARGSSLRSSPLGRPRSTSVLQQYVNCVRTCLLELRLRVREMQIDVLALQERNVLHDECRLSQFVEYHSMT